MARPAPRAPAGEGPAEGEGAIGFDESPEMRPGVPRETMPQPAEGSHWTAPERQTARRGHLHRKGLDRLTPVFGTVQPPRGLSGLVRRIAYRVPEHRARHWMMLLAADRIDVAEGRLGDALGRPLRQRGFERAGRAVQTDPLRSIGAVAALAVGTAILLRRALE